MGSAGFLVASLAALSQAPATSMPLPPPSGGYLGAEHRTAELATWMFAFGCLQRLSDPPGEFAKRSDELGAEIASDHPSEASAVGLDGGQGAGCRVRFSGSDAQMVWRAWTGVLTTPRAAPSGAGCTVDQTLEQRVSVHCIDGGSPARRWRIAVERSTLGDDASVQVLVRLTP